MIRDEEVDELAEKLREAGSGRKEPEHFLEMAREILQDAELLRDNPRTGASRDPSIGH